LERALDLYVRLFGPDHRRAIRAVNNLAVYWERVGGIREARRLHEQAYAGRRRAVGDRHQETLYSATSYGRVLRVTGELRESRRLLEGALTMSRNLLGLEDPTTLSITRELAATQRRLGELEAARTLGRHTLKIYDQIRKPEHPDRLACLNTLALTYSALGNQPEALQLGQQCVDLHGERFGGAISSTWLVRANLASYLRRAGELVSARELIDAVVEGLTALFENTNVFVLQVSIISANVRFAAGAPAEAHQIEQWVYEAMVEPLGESHPDRLIAGCNLAATRETLGDTAGLAEFRRDLAALAARALPAHHPIAQAIVNGDRWECELDLPGS
jgi:tetratricopeptide (TPR) repeat protein